MTITLIDSASRAGISTKNDALELKNSDNASAAHSEFGQLMTDIQETRKSLEKMALDQAAITELAQQTLDGQEIAAQMSSQGVAFTLPLTPNLPVQDFLKTVILGPHLNVITPETSAPNDQSLEAFARSQGLDETAVQWLMGTAGPAGAATQALTTEGLNLGNGQTLADASALTQNRAIDHLKIQLSVASGSGVAPGNINPSLVDASQATGEAHSVNAAASPVTQKTDALSSGGMFSSAALWALAQTAEKTEGHTRKTDEASEANAVQLHFMRAPPPAALWMQSSSAVAASLAKETPSHKSSVAISDLDLSEFASTEVLTRLTQNTVLGETAVLDAADIAALESGSSPASEAPPSPLSGHMGHRTDPSAAARQEAQNANAAPTAPESNTAQRSEIIQNLSEKMGQAVGQRILSEIEKGQWHLKLMLRPATLGHIEVEIRMRSGEMDAFFTAPQALTRELLQDGLSKLKDTLGQMGMDVASMQVGDGQTQQRGGDSTPRETSKVINSDSKESKLIETQKINIPRAKMGKDGWDVLV